MNKNHCRYTRTPLTLYNLYLPIIPQKRSIWEIKMGFIKTLIDFFLIFYRNFTYIYRFFPNYSSILIPIYSLHILTRTKYTTSILISRSPVLVSCGQVRYNLFNTLNTSMNKILNIKIIFSYFF